jgi:hypothetical protein
MLPVGFLLSVGAIAISGEIHLKFVFFIFRVILFLNYLSLLTVVRQSHIAHNSLVCKLEIQEYFRAAFNC